MCGRLLNLWHASYGDGSRVTGRDKIKLGRLVLMVRRGGCQLVWGVGEACSSCQGPRRRGVVKGAWLRSSRGPAGA